MRARLQVQAVARRGGDDGRELPEGGVVAPGEDLAAVDQQRRLDLVWSGGEGWYSWW